MAYTVLVTGATGKQGSAVIDALLASSSVKDILIFALTRNPESAPAKALQAKAPEKIELVKGDLKDCNAVFKRHSLANQGGIRGLDSGRGHKA